ncbi:MAG: methyltransferase [Bacteroidaceae bacterium]|nr:methyltransferase [Bacteroidaceae bacterium]
MSEPKFRFRQFEVWHDRCAMKVGTDGVLLGAWAGVEERSRILDIGTGTGLIALMAAQRAPEATVWGIEIDDAAAAQAEENARRSPFADRLRMLRGDVRTFDFRWSFDAILCNPPFFTEDTLPPDAQRTLARNSVSLRFGELISAAVRLLTPDGEFHVILPTSAANDFITQSFMNGLYVRRKCAVRTVARKEPKRQMLSFSRDRNGFAETEELILQEPDGSRTPAYASLTKDFYL